MNNPRIQPQKNDSMANQLLNSSQKLPVSEQQTSPVYCVLQPVTIQDLTPQETPLETVQASNSAEAEAMEPTLQAKKRGRKKGSKNKPKNLIFL